MPISKRTPAREPSYLERLKFDPRLANSWVAKYIANIRVVLLMVLSIALLGVMSLVSLPKRLNPEVKIPIVTVVTILPGAGPADVESLVTKPLEDQVRSVQGLDTVTSTSLDNISVITAQFLSSVDRDKAKSDVQSSVDSVTGLPSDAQTPKVTALDFENVPIWQFALTTNKSLPDLMRFADSLKTAITNEPTIDHVDVSGYETQEIVVDVDPEKMQDYGLNPMTLAASLKKATASYPAGTVNTTNNIFALTIDPSVTTIDDIRNIRLSVSSKTVKLADIAIVTQHSKPGLNESFIATANSAPQRIVTFSVYKTTSTNIDTAGAKVKTIVDAQIGQQNGAYKVTTISNTSDDINKQFSDLLREFRSTIILVFGCLFLFLGLRQALISSVTIPLTFLSAFFFMQFFGMSINFLTLFALLLALGLLVDDTIVTVSAMTTYFKTKKFTPMETGLLVWKDTIVPIWSTTITTIWSFVPLLITSGIIGEFIKPIPIVVTVTMLSSTAIACLITLPVMIQLLKLRLPRRVVILLRVIAFIAALVTVVTLSVGNPFSPIIIILFLVLAFVTLRVLPVLLKGAQSQIRRNKLAHNLMNLTSKYSAHGIINVEGFSAWYKRTILRILNNAGSRRKVIAAIVIYAIFSFALLPLGFVKNEFFPKSDQNEFSVNLELPAGTNTQNTTKTALEILEMLRQTPESDFVSLNIGSSNGGGYGPSISTTNNAYFTVHLKPKEERHITSITLAENVRQQFKNYNQGKISVEEGSSGPPAGSDVQITLLGDDLTTLDQYANKLQEYLSQQPGITNVDKSVKSGTSKLVFVPDQNKLADAGIGVDQIGGMLRLYASGFTLDSINFDKSTSTKTDINFRIQPNEGNPEDLGRLTVVSPNTGRPLPLLSLGSLEVKASPTIINRKDGKRSISVSAAVKSGYNATNENQKLLKYADTLQLPTGYAWQTGGANEENAKSVQSILQAMIISAILILITMVIQFGSFRQAIIVLIVIPLAVSSVFLAFALTGTPLSFPALIGVLSLFGIVVTNSMFIVDKINLNLKEKMPFKEAIADAGASRMEPIILTKLCTVFGLLPITISDPLWRGLGGAIISGLLVASTIMLLFIPVLYYAWFNEKNK